MKLKLFSSTVAARLLRLILGFVLILSITGALSYLTLARLKVNGPVYAGIVQQKDLLGDILPPPMYILETYMTALQVLGETEPDARKADLEKLASLKKDFADRTEYWSKELSDSPLRRVLIENSHKPAAAFFDVLEKEFIPAIEKQDKVLATEIAYGKLKSDYLEHRKAIDQAVTLASQNSEVYETAAAKEVRLRTSVMIGAILTGLLIIGFYSVAMARALIRVIKSTSDQLAEGSAQVSVAAGEVSASSQTLAEGASEQAASLEETSASMEEMATMTKRNAGSAGQAHEIAKQAREAADRGVRDMQAMSAAMEAIDVASDDIAKIIKTIDEIAFQTNILALNAAVEAARAGEAGMGFAVVADEVRNLSQRCAQAAKETTMKIEGAITKTGQGVEISNKVAAALGEITTKVRQVDELVTEVASATREQTEGITQINMAVSQMEKVTQNNASCAEEAAAAAEELNSQAEVMKHSVAELQALVGGNHGSSGKKAAPVIKSKTFQMIAPAKGRFSPLNGSNNDQSEASADKGIQTTASRRNEIPMEGEFKDF